MKIIGIEDVMNFMKSNSTEEDIESIRLFFQVNEITNNLYDELKMKLVLKAVKKYSLKELEKRLGTEFLI